MGVHLSVGRCLTENEVALAHIVALPKVVLLVLTLVSSTCCREMFWACDALQLSQESS